MTVVSIFCVNYANLADPQLRVRVGIVWAVRLPISVRARGGRAEEVQGAQRAPVKDAQVRRPVEHVLEGVRRPVSLLPTAARAEVVDEIAIKAVAHQEDVVFRIRARHAALGGFH